MAAFAEQTGLEVVRVMVRYQQKLLQCEFVGEVVAAAAAGAGLVAKQGRGRRKGR